MADKKQLAYQADWERRNIRRYTVKINTQNEPEMAKWMESKSNKQGYIKSLVEADMKRTGSKNEKGDTDMTRTITYNGTTYTLTQEAYFNEGLKMYEATAEHSGQAYMVRWEVIDAETEWEDEMCDWDNPASVEEI